MKANRHGVMSTYTVFIVGTCEGPDCNFQHNAPEKVISSQDGGRLGERARARAEHSWSEFVKVEGQSHACAMLAAQRSRWRRIVEGHPCKISRTAAAIATN